MCPDVNCLPRGDATSYKHTWPQIYLEKGCAVDPSAVIGGGCVVGDGCVIGPGAVIERVHARPRRRRRRERAAHRVVRHGQRTDRTERGGDERVDL